MMFEYQLGSLLGKSNSEIRSLPYPEFRTWQLMYILEPWGWHDREIRTASILAKINNAFISKSSQAKKPDYFMRDMEKSVLDKLLELKIKNNLDKMEPEERKKYIVQEVKNFFGVK